MSAITSVRGPLRQRRILRRIAAILMATGVATAGLSFALVQVGTDAGAASGGSFDLDQCANGGVGNPIEVCIGSQWQNGNLGQASSQYMETSSVPFRAKLGGIDTGTSHTLVLEWDTTHSADKHTYDFLTTYDQTESGADPCSGIVSCNPAVFTTFAIPTDPNVPLDPNWSGTQIPGVFTFFGGTITDVSPYSLSAPYSAGGSSTQVTVTFTADVADPVLAWSGHVGTQDNWGQGHAASAIPGSPYHMRVLDLDGSGGNQDRSLSVTTPANGIRVVQSTVPSDAADFGFAVTGPGLFSDTFTLDDDADATLSDTHTLNGLSAETYTVTQNTVPGWAVTSITCDTGTWTADLTTRSVTITLDDDFPSCTFVNEQRATITIIQDTIPDSGKDIGFTETGIGGGPFTLDDDADGTLSNSTTFVVAPGTYTVTQDIVAGFPLGALDCVTTFGTGATTGTDLSTRTATIDLTDVSSVECTFANTKASSTLAVTKTVSPDPVESLRPATFAVDVQNTAAVDVTIETLVDDIFGEIVPSTDAAIDSTTCVVPHPLIPGATYSCTFTTTIQDAPGTTHDDTVTASGTDEDGEAVSAAGSASVSVVAPVWNDEISIIENSDPDAARDFGFTVTGPGGSTGFGLDDDADATLSNTETESALDPGAYTVTQDAVAAWPLTGISCSGGSTSVDLANRSVTITIADGDFVSCTFTNTKTPSTIDVAKLITPDPVASGGTGTFQVTVENTSVVDVTITSLDDDVFGDITDSGNPLLGITACTVPQSLAPAATYSCAFAATITELGGATHTDTVTASGTDEDGAVVTGAGSATVPVVDPLYTADVKVVKTVDPGSAPTGTEVTFTMIVSNLGPDQGMDVNLEEVLPTGLAYGSSTVSSGTYDPASRTWALGMMTVGQDETLTIHAIMTSAAVNTATVSTASIDPNPDNNLSVAGVTVTAPAAGSSGLPLTGLSGGLLLGGLIAVLVGGVLVVIGRPRRLARR